MDKVVFQTLLEGQKSSISRKYSLIIPAAGKGSRLGYDKPKVLYPLCGKPLLYYILKPFQDYVSEVIMVINPKNLDEIKNETEKLKFEFPVKFSYQEEPLGMAHAVYCAKSNTSNNNVIVIWGDQVGYTSLTVSCLIQLFESHENVSMCLPTKQVLDPYINIVRDCNQSIIEVQQRRESINLPALGESDGGLFVFDGMSLFEIIERELQNADHIGKATGEFNLLPLFPEFEKKGSVLTMQLSDINETIGINSLDDVKIAENQIMAINEKR